VQHSAEVDFWFFDWEYVVMPATLTVPALTAWDLVSSSGGGTTAQVTLGATIASESVVVSSHFATGKYSFALASTLSPGVPDQTTNRVTGLTWTIKNANNNVVVQQAAGSKVVDNKPGSTPYAGPPALDFTYTANAGTYGKVSNALMDSTNSASATGTSPSDHVPGDAPSPSHSVSRTRLKLLRRGAARSDNDGIARGQSGGFVIRTPRGHQGSPCAAQLRT
jgi:hypothetical protein